MIRLTEWLTQTVAAGQLVIAALQVVTSIILVAVTWRYVHLTKKLADAAEAQHAETVKLHDERKAPNLLLVQPIDRPNYFGYQGSGSASIRPGDKNQFHLVNLGAGTVWITSWKVAVQAEERDWTRGPEGPRESLLKPGGVHPVYLLPAFLPRTFHEPGAVDEFGNPLFNEPGVHTVVFTVNFFYSETGPEKHVARFLLKKDGDGVSIDSSH